MGMYPSNPIPLSNVFLTAAFFQNKKVPIKIYA